jgi:hypothetical protein
MVLQMNCDIKRNQAGTARAQFGDELSGHQRFSLDLPHPQLIKAQSLLQDRGVSLPGQSLVPKFRANVREDNRLRLANMKCEGL